ncbi:hypothetical protein XBP1_1510012 [Xenorhabdus bovienii str. puntauvense]|uniref:Uncharacterized protein n=1 Tax=Xenorhabdus bovienii str. puntauvense TaxID=1398201 RepID=A0A077NBY9_XENBV|nr:hypothetical protein XBP1_1510012 [Xenorhabdus bovienii str. puntauvense]
MCFFFRHLNKIERISVANGLLTGIIASVFRVLLEYFSAEVAKSVDAVDSKSTAFGCAGSIPAFGTIR